MHAYVPMKIEEEILIVCWILTQLVADFFKKPGGTGSGQGQWHVCTCVLFRCVCPALPSQTMSEYVSAQSTVQGSVSQKASYTGMKMDRSYDKNF